MIRSCKHKDLKLINSFHAMPLSHSYTPGKRPKTRVLTRPYRGRLTVSSQLKLAEYFPNWVFPIFLNPIKMKNKYWFFVHTHGYKLQFDYDHLLITMLH